MSDKLITFTAEVLEVKAKKDGLDKMFKIVLQTNEEQALEMQQYIADKTIIVGVKEGE